MKAATRKQKRITLHFVRIPLFFPPYVKGSDCHSSLLYIPAVIITWICVQPLSSGPAALNTTHKKSTAVLTALNWCNITNSVS